MFKDLGITLNFLVKGNELVNKYFSHMHRERYLSVSTRDYHASLKILMFIYYTNRRCYRKSYETPKMKFYLFITLVSLKVSTSSET